MTSMMFTRISPAGYAVFALGFALRLIAWANTSVINPDGALFIHQARAIYYGETDTLFCAVSYLSNLPIMIAGSYWLFHDWVIAARFVSFVFGWATLIPLYFLFKRFFHDQTSVLGTLIFAVMPIFVGSSVDIIRDPIAWFFTVLGLYWFVLGLEDKPSSIFILSCLSFMMAAWARIEGAFLILFSLLYLLATRQERKNQNILCFLLPIIGVSGIALILGLLSQSHSALGTHMKTALLAKLTSPLAQYHTIQQQLAEAALRHRNDNFGSLLGEVKKNLWLVALGSLLNRCLEAFFYPFFLVCIVGLGPALKESRSNPSLRYLICIGIMLLAIIYWHISRSWYIEYRHICLLIISCIPLFGFGINRITSFFTKRFHWSNRIISVIMTVLIFVLPFYKNILPRDSDKRVFKNIGELVFMRETGKEVISISLPCSIFRIISFYANLNYRGAPCPEGSDRDCWENFTHNYDEFLQHLRNENIKYFLWSEKLWPGDRIDLFQPPYNAHFKELGRWSHPDTGEMILFEVT
jgi:hypothetical protein